MYAIAIIRYRLTLDEVLPHVDEHRAYLRELKAQGTLLVAGPMEPRHGGMLLLKVPDEGAPASLDAIRDGDPFTRKGVAQYEVMQWMPVIGKDDLDRL